MDSSGLHAMAVVHHHVHQDNDCKVQSKKLSLKKGYELTVSTPIFSKHQICKITKDNLSA